MQNQKTHNLLNVTDDDIKLLGFAHVEKKFGDFDNWKIIEL